MAATLFLPAQKHIITKNYLSEGSFKPVTPCSGVWADGGSMTDRASENYPQAAEAAPSGLAMLVATLESLREALSS